MKPVVLVWILLVALFCIGNGCKKKNTSLTEAVAGSYKMHGESSYSHPSGDSVDTGVALAISDTILTVAAINDSVIGIGSNLYTYSAGAITAYTFYSYGSNWQGDYRITLVFYKNYPDSVSLNLEDESFSTTSYLVLNGRKL